MNNITKRFPGVLALKNVDFQASSGEIHALVGENGAGKSTLIKILSGVHRQYEGEIVINGESVSFKNPREAIESGIGVIYQELNLIDDLTVAENIYIGQEGCSWGNLKKKDMQKRATELLNGLNFSIHSKEKVKKLNVSQKQLVVIAKAMASDIRLLVMDEPTATITQHETAELFKIMRRLKEKGVAIIFISHRLEEVFEIADRVSVLRDGNLISTRLTDEYDHDILVRDMVGRDISNMFPKENIVKDSKVLSVKNLNVPGSISDISFDVYAGEIFGISGLVGSGKNDIGLALYGALKGNFEEYKLLSKELNLLNFSPQRALAWGIVLIPEDRKTEGLVLNLNVMKNIILPNLERVQKYGVISWKKSRDISNEMINQLRIKTPSFKQKVSNLSGGNQQKVVLAKGLLKSPKLIIFIEPTRGIDVGAKVEVYTLMNELANKGAGIIMISSELPEVVSMSDRVLVMHRGKQSVILEKERITQENIISAAMGG